MLRFSPSSPKTASNSFCRTSAGYCPVALANQTRLVPQPSKGSDAVAGLSAMRTGGVAA
ncbi:hypothetical protein QE392_001258 [Microbacterium proteolyticum]|uniref:hypothetical protein n=1 Tax=Microbacterium proteolyticum TaxID=1572644 RepID=UPI0027800386|nr:hypothetical protein [Microbacterium proteolyticum]MDQ1169454.1 hypothetical protein [Microbacterium proteolyticum]